MGAGEYGFLPPATVIDIEKVTYATVISEITKILMHYGVNQLAEHLRGVIRKMNKKFVAYQARERRILHRRMHFYSYNQDPPPSRGKRVAQTPAAEKPLTGRAAVKTLWLIQEQPQNPEQDNLMSAKSS